MNHDTIQILLDAPASAVTQTQIAKVGSFKDRRYGEFQITATDIADWKRNLALLPGGRALIDEDHSADRSQPFRDTEAAGWITDVNLVDGKPVATLEWTPKGAQAIDEKRYLFFSPTFGPFRTEDGTVHRNVLTGGALTNKPFLNMPAIQLASDTTMEKALEADPAWRLFELATSGELGDDAKRKAIELSGGDPQERSDSRRLMELTTEQLKTLGLDDTATEQDVTAKLTELAAGTGDTKTLDQLAKDDGKIVLDQAAFDTLQSQVKTLAADAEAGREARQELHQTKFNQAWDKAVEELRVLDNDDGKSRERWEKFYTLDAETTLEQLQALPPVVNTKPAGHGGTVTLEREEQLLDPNAPDYHVQKRILDVRKQLEKDGKDPNNEAEVTKALMAQLEAA